MNFEEENIKTSNIQSLILEPLNENKKEEESFDTKMNYHNLNNYLFVLINVLYDHILHIHYIHYVYK